MSRMGSSSTPVANPGLTMTIVGVCLGLLGLFLINPLAIPGVAGLVFSIWGRIRSRDSQGSARTLTRVLSIIGIVVSILAIVGFVLGLFVHH
jgi:hypothetical protein